MARPWRRGLLLVGLVLGLLPVVDGAEQPAGAVPGHIDTVVGGGGGHPCPPSVDAWLDDPTGAAVDAEGNVFVADSLNHRVRRIASDGSGIQSVAGDGTAVSAGDGGLAVDASLKRPYGVVVDDEGNLFISEFEGHRVRRVDAVTGVITTVVGNGTASSTGDGGPAEAATVNGPIGLAFDPAGNLHVAEYAGARVRRIDATTGAITTVAGSGTLGYQGDGGPATAAQLNHPYSIDFEDDSDLVIADTDNHRIRHVSSVSAIITTIAGTGTAGSSGDGGQAINAQFNRPTGVLVHDGYVYVADYNNHQIRAFEPGLVIFNVGGTGTSGSSGDNGPAHLAQFARPVTLAVDSHDNMVVVDRNSDRVRRIHFGLLQKVTRLAGSYSGYSGDCDPPAATALAIGDVRAVAGAPDGDVYLAEDAAHRVLRLDRETQTVSVVVGAHSEDDDGGDGGPASAADVSWPSGLAVASDGDLVIAAGRRIRRVDAQTHVITTVAGTGTYGQATDGGLATESDLMLLSGRLTGMAFDADQNLHFVAYGIYRVDAETNVLTRVAGGNPGLGVGDGGPARDASLNAEGIAFAPNGDLFVADSDDVHRVRKIDAETQVITTVAGTGAGGPSPDGGPADETPVMRPIGVAVAANGDLFISEWGTDRVRRVDSGEGIITTVAGNGTAGYSGDGGPATQAAMLNPGAIILHDDGLYISDIGNDRVRLVEGSVMHPSGLLRVTTSPPLAATIEVNGTPRDSWGLNWLPMPAGQHEVCFGHVPGYTTPPCQQVVIGDGLTTNVVGNYAARGFLRVITSPAVPSTISVDGVPRNDWGVWTEVDPGTYNVCFGAVADFDPPSCRDVVVTAGATATTTGTFTFSPGAPSPSGSYGFVRATTAPAVGSTISIDGEWRDSWGLTWVKIPVGPHQVCWSPVAAADPPSCQNVVVSAGTTSTVEGSFALRGFLRVQTNPALPATIRVEGSRTNAWGVWTSKPPATYEVCFEAVGGFTTPPCQDAVVTAGATTTVTGNYG